LLPAARAAKLLPNFCPTRARGSQWCDSALLDEAWRSCSAGPTATFPSASGHSNYAITTWRLADALSRWCFTARHSLLGSRHGAEPPALLRAELRRPCSRSCDIARRPLPALARTFIALLSHRSLRRQPGVLLGSFRRPVGLYPARGASCCGWICRRR